MALDQTYARLIEFLDQHDVPYRIIDHAPEGRTELVSAMRGHQLGQAAKCMVLMIKLGKKTKKYVLTVVPGDRRVDFGAIKKLLNATYVSLAAAPEAERLAGSVAGTILPFTFHQDLELIVDPSLLEPEEIYFNAARLDRSLALRTDDYLELAKPRLERIAKEA